MKIIPDMRKRGSMMILFSVIAYPVLLILFLQLVFPLICRNGENYLNYFILTSVTLFSLTPFLLAAAVVSVLGEKLSELFGSGKGKYSSWLPALKGSLVFALIGFGVIIPVIYISDPVPSEGWLRSVSAALLLGFIVPVIIVRMYMMKLSSRVQLATLLLSFLMIISVPIGLVLHHPWNYFLFISPLYWIGWSWVISSPSESLLYGMIALILLSAIMIASFRSLRKIGHRA